MLPDPTSPDAVSHEINVVPMNFRKEFRPVAGAPGEFKEVHALDLVKKGSHGESTPWTIKALQQNPELWNYTRPFYERWLEGQEDPVDGTPLDVLPFVHKNLVDHLRSLHIRTAEDLAGLTDNDMQRVGMGARMMRDKARLYVQNKEGDAKLADALAERDAENANLRSELEELKAQVNALAPKEKKAAK